MAATLTRLGELRTRGHDYNDAGEQTASIQTYSMDGLRLRLDRDGGDAPLFPGTGYEIRPNDGWAVDRDIDARSGGHWAHLVDNDGASAAELPLTDGAVVLDRSRR